jgi:hypothetical protein
MIPSTNKRKRKRFMPRSTQVTPGSFQAENMSEKFSQRRIAGRLHVRRPGGRITVSAEANVDFRFPAAVSNER